MSILLFTNLLSGSTGLDKSVVMTSNALHARGADITVVNFISGEHGLKHLIPRWPFEDGVPVAPLRSLAAEGGRHLSQNMFPVIKDRIPNLNYSFTEGDLAALRQLNRHLDDTDVIVFTHPLQVAIFRRAIGSDPRRCRTILQIHGHYSARHVELLPMLLENASVVDDLQIVSRGLEEDFVDHFETDQIHWIPNIHEPSAVEHVPSSTVRIALIGSFQDAKNQLDAVRMMQRLSDLDVSLTLWGNASSKYAAHVQAVVNDSGLADRITFAGIGTELDIYSTADIVVIPSRSEGFGYALVEAASHRIPVVSYDYKFGPRDVIVDGKSGFIVPPGDLDAMSQRVRQLAEDPELRERFGRRARQVFDETFAPDRVAELYDELMGPYAKGTFRLADVFPIDGSEPVDEGSIRVRSLNLRGRPVVFFLRFSSRRRLRRFEVQSRARRRRVRSLRLGSTHHLALLAGDPGRRPQHATTRSVTYECDDPSLGRFYLGNTNTNREVEVRRHLLRSPGQDVPACISDMGTRRDDAPDISRDAGFEVDRGQLRLARHPRELVTGARDNFGHLASEQGGVQIANVVHRNAHSVSVRGEFDSVDLTTANGTRQFASPYTYAELFELLVQVEQEQSLFDHQTVDGIHPWELYRGAFIASLCEGLGLWGPHFNSSATATWDVYSGDKSLQTLSHFDRVLFEFPRKGDGPDERTRAFQDERTLIIEYPQPFGYSAGIYTEPNRYPIQEFNLWRREHKATVPDTCDPRPFEDALTAAFGFPISLGSTLDHRIKKFVDERNFWTEIFNRIEPGEVVIPSSHWSAGICEAARRSGAVVSDVQYALTSKYHPSYWFGSRPHHGAERFYAWSPFWAKRTNAYDESLIQGRDPASWQPEEDTTTIGYDICVVSQPRVTRRILAFVEEFARRRPGARICLAPHPDERTAFSDRLGEVARLPGVEVATTSTLAAIARSEVCVGGYSTSLYEAAAMGKPTYVLPVPGHEILRDDIEAGLFRLTDDIEGIVPFSVPQQRRTIFGTQPDSES